jgi:hypothetical protein
VPMRSSPSQQQLQYPASLSPHPPHLIVSSPLSSSVQTGSGSPLHYSFPSMPSPLPHNNDANSLRLQQQAAASADGTPMCMDPTPAADPFVAPSSPAADPTFGRTTQASHCVSEETSRQSCEQQQPSLPHPAIITPTSSFQLHSSSCTQQQEQRTAAPPPPQQQPNAASTFFGDDYQRVHVQQHGKGYDEDAGAAMTPPDSHDRTECFNPVAITLLRNYDDDDGDDDDDNGDATQQQQQLPYDNSEPIVREDLHYLNLMDRSSYGDDSYLTLGRQRREPVRLLRADPPHVPRPLAIRPIVKQS